MGELLLIGGFHSPIIHVGRQTVHEYDEQYRYYEYSTSSTACKNIPSSGVFVLYNNRDICKKAIEVSNLTL